MVGYLNQVGDPGQKSGLIGPNICGVMSVIGQPMFLVEQHNTQISLLSLLFPVVQICSIREQIEYQTACTLFLLTL